MLQFTLNIFGLAFGMAVFMVIQLYIGNERDYDRFWQNFDSIYRISATWNSGEGKVRRATLPPPVGPALEEYDPILHSTRILYWSDFTMRPDTDSMNVFRETNTYIADKNFFKVFQNRLIAGDEQSALKMPGSVILSESAARRYFGDMPADEILNHHLLGGKDAGTVWNITGVMKDIPSNSHMDFDMLVSMWPEFSENSDWSWHIMHTYVRAKEEADEDTFNDIFTSIINDKLIPHFVNQGFIEASSNPEDYELSAIQLTGIHLESDWEDSIQKGVRDEYLDILNYASILVFLLACVNFINISTALSFYRTGEIGVRKIHGASFVQLLRMIISEYSLQILSALFIGLCISEFLTLMLHQFFGISLHKNMLDLPGFVLKLCSVLLAVTIAASLYPTWLLIHGRSVQMAKGRLSFIRGKGLRNSLIIFQFFIAVLLLGFAFTIYNQLDYIRNRDLGFNKNDLIVIQNDREIEEQRDAFVNTVNQVPGVSGISFSTGIPAQPRYHIREIRLTGSRDHLPMQWYEIDQYYLDVMEITLLAGRNFEGIPSDSGKVLLNETAVKMLGLDNPIGQLLTINEGSPDEHQVTIAGVVGDYNQEGFRLHVQPLVLEYLDNYIFKDYVAIRLNGMASGETLNKIAGIWSEFEPQVPVTYSSLTTKYNRLYSSELLLSRIIGFFSILAMIIAAIGLFGVSSVAIEQQTKEIGIKKVFGATVFTIITDQIKKFIYLVIMGIVFAIPLSLYLSSQWLESFVYRVDLNPWLFLLTSIIILILTILVVGFRSLSASLKNPIHSLRAE